MADESEWVEVRAILVTDAVLDGRYGRLRIPPETLRRLAGELNLDASPWVAQHDPTQRMRIRNRHAHVEEHADGTGWALAMDAEVHRDDWATWQSVLAAAGVPGGMSVGLTEPIQVPSEPPGLDVAGDAADFRDEDLLALAAGAPHGLPVAVSRLYQFAADPESVRLIVGFTMAVLQAVPANLIAEWLGDAIALVRGQAVNLRRPPALDVRYRRDTDGGVEFETRLRIDDDEQAVTALSSIMAMLESLNGE